MALNCALSSWSSNSAAGLFENNCVEYRDSRVVWLWIIWGVKDDMISNKKKYWIVMNKATLVAGACEDGRSILIFVEKLKDQSMNGD